MFKTRHGFFFGAAIVCWTMTLVIEASFRWVTIGTGVLYLVLSVLFLLHEMGQTPLAGSPDSGLAHGTHPAAASSSPVPPSPPIVDRDR